jgi:DNA mismatch repair protein MSH2
LLGEKPTSWRTLAEVSITAPFVFAVLNLPTEKHIESEFPPELTDEGLKIVDELLSAWAQPAVDGEDVVMTDDSPQAQLEELKRCVAQFQPRIEANPWLVSVLGSLS